MAYPQIQDLLNRYKWDEDKTSERWNIYITIIHRGAEHDEKKYSYFDIEEIGKNSFMVEGDKGLVYIPYHRIKAITNIQTGKTLYKKYGL